MSADLLARLIEAGTPAALVGEVAMQLARAEAVAEIVEQRRAKDRARKAIPRNSTDSTESAEIHNEPLSPQSPPKVSPGPLSNTPPIPPKPANEPTRGSRLSDGWQPEVLNGKAAAMVRAWQAGEIERELAKFRNYWMGKAGKDACKTNWQRTWINWLISADERKPQNGQSNRGSGGRVGGPRPDPTLAIVRAAIEAQRQSGGDYR